MVEDTVRKKHANQGGPGKPRKTKRRVGASERAARSGMRKRLLYSINGSMVRAKRLYKEMTQEQLAEKVGVSRRTIINWENGDNQPYKRQLKDLAAGLDCQPSDLLMGTARALYKHIETMVLEHMMCELGDMEDGKVPNLDIQQFTALCEKLGVFSRDGAAEPEESAAEAQLSEEVR